MIGKVRGILLAKHPTEILVDVQGLGYEIQMPLSTLYKLPDVGKEVMLHTHFVVREDAQLLFGFIDIKEKELFRTLIKVNGVGPRMALAILSGMAVEEFVQTINRSDISALIKMPGIGRKTAERLIIEMRDRLGNLSATGEISAGLVQRSAESQLSWDAETALQSLGYKPAEASRAVAAVLKDNKEIKDHETLIRLALKSMG